MRDKELQIMNKIIELIYSAKNFNELRVELLNGISKLVDFSFSDFVISDVRENQSPDFRDSIVLSRYNKINEREFLCQYDQKYFRMDNMNWAFTSGDSFVYRESDLITKEAKCQSRFYTEYLDRFGFAYIAGMIVASESGVLGLVSFYKNERSGDFTDEDMKIFSMLLPHLKRCLNVGNRIKAFKMNNNRIMLKYQYHLTDREIEMAGLLIYGYNNHEIVKILGISINTVKKHVSNIFSKLGISGRPQLVRFIIVNGLLDIWDNKYGLLEELQ